MLAKVGENGLLIPRDMLAGTEEVEISRVGDRIVILPAGREDPIVHLGREPIACGLTDASENHDKYLYESKK